MSDQQNKQDDKMEDKNRKPDDNMGLNVSGHILIRDKETGQELVNKRS